MTEPATDKTAPIFDIQSFSIHDGPGIRTTIFFKGCQLNCLWCHNPESKTAKPQIMYYRNRCTGCMLCVECCKTGAQIILPDGTHDMNHEKCNACCKCLDVCCYDALRICGNYYGPKELYEKIKGDIRYFALEGEKKGEPGGITFSGGEPLKYAGFIRDFCSLIPDVHTVLETSGYGTIKNLELIMDYIDLYLFDIKITNSTEHKKFCGVDNDTVFYNLKFLYENKKNIILRLPLIPGFNDTEEHFSGIAELLIKYPGIKRVEILPYHNFGLAKAEALGLKPSPELPRQNTGKETIEKWLGEFRTRGLANVYCA